MNAPTKLRRHLCFLDVGHGSAAVLIAGDDIVLIDVGKHSALAEFLDEQQILQIGSIYLSHADEDHIGALVGLLGSPQLSINRVFLNTDSTQGSKVWDDLLYELNAAHRSGKLEFTPSLTAGHTEQLSGQVSVHVLGPSHYLAARGPGNLDRRGRRIRTNSVSATVAVGVGDQRLALLPGDLDGIGLTDLHDNKADLSAPILVFPHHGGLPGNMDVSVFARTLLEAVVPEHVVFSIGRGRHRTPNPAIVDTIHSTLPDARIVCTQLSEHCSPALPPDHAATHLADVFAHGRAKSACCGGTIVVSLDQPPSLRPSATAHTKFIKTHVATPLCLRAATQPTVGANASSR